MNFELKITAPQNAPVVWNFDELKADLTTALADYQSRIYTEDMLNDAKADRAKLNKLRDAIDAERKNRKKEYMKPFETFEDQAKELCELIDTTSSGIKEQLDSFEEKRTAEKQTVIQTIFDEVMSNYDLPFIRLDKILNEKWLNKGTSEKTIATEITAICEKALKDLEIIKRLPYAYEAKCIYENSLDLNYAIEQGELMSSVAKGKAEAVKVTASTEDSFVVCFKATVTRKQAEALASFCKANGIKLERI